MKKIIVCSCFVIFLPVILYSQGGYGWKYFYQYQRDTITMYYYYDTNDVRNDNQNFFVRVLQVEEMNCDKSKANYQIEESVYNCQLKKFLCIKILIPVGNGKYSYIEFIDEKKLSDYKDEDFYLNLSDYNHSKIIFNLLCN